MAGAMLRVVCANSQKASTPRMMPKRSLSSPRYGAGSRVIVANLRAESFGSLFQRSRFVDSRKTGNDQPNLIARPRTPNVTTNPAIIAGRRPTPSAVESDVGAGAEHRSRDVNLMTEEHRRDVAQRVANDSSDRCR